MPCIETIIRNMYLKEDHMSGKNIIVMGKQGVVANKTGSDGDTSGDEIYNVRFEDGSISTIPVRDMQMIGESVEQLDEGLVLASDDLNAVKKTAQKLAKQSPDLTYYVVKHKNRIFNGKQIPYYEVYASVDMHMVRNKATKVVGYGAKVDMRESVELDEDYKEMMKWYEKSDEKKVYDILKKNKFNLPADSFTLVQNTLKKSKNVNNAASMIMLKYPQFRKESVELGEVKMDPTEHVKKDDETGMYCVYNKGGEKVKEFKDKADADNYAADNHDSLMENRLTDIVKKAMQTLAGKKGHSTPGVITNPAIRARGEKPPKGNKPGKDVLVRTGPGPGYYKDTLKGGKVINSSFTGRDDVDSVELDEVINSPARGRAKEANIKRGRKSDPGGDMVIIAGKDSSGKVFYATSIDRTSGDILKVGTNAKEAVKLTKGNATKLVRGKASFVTAINLNKGIGNTKKVSDAELKKLIGESVKLDEAFDMKKMLKIFNKLKKNDTIKIKYDSSMRKGKDFQTFVVTSPKRTVGKAGVERVIMKHVDNLKGVKYTLYNRKGSVSLAVGDMAASMTDIQESVKLDEAWTADSVIKNAEIGSKKGYGINIKKTGGITKTPYKHMLMTMRRDKSVRVTFDHGKNEFEGTPKSVALYLNKLLGIKESVELGEGKVPSRPTRIAVSKEFDKVTRSGKMDTMAAKKHLEKKFKITDVRIEKDKNGKPHVTYFQESVELDEADRPMQFPGKMSGGKMKGKFTNAQLKQLKDAYGKIGRINPESKAYETLTAYLDGMNKAQLKQLVDAKIPFMSSLALNRVHRAK